MRKVINLEDQLRQDEDERLSAYQDNLGFWTIGVGRLIDKRKGGGITKEESAYLLQNDIRRKSAELMAKLPWIVDLSPARQGVLLNMAFQMGSEGVLKFRETLILIQRGKYDEAAVAMLNSVWAKQTPERAHRLSDQMRTGVWQ